MGLTDCSIWVCDNCGTEAKTSGTYKERFPEKWFVLSKRIFPKLPKNHGHWDTYAFYLNLINWKQTEYFCSFTCLLQSYTKEES